MVLGYLILQFYFSIFFLVLVSINKIYQTLNTVFHHASNHLDVRQKYFAARRVFNSLLGVCKCGQYSLECWIYYYNDYRRLGYYSWVL